MSRMGHVEHHTQTALDARHVVGGKLADTIACRTVVHVQLANQVCQLTRINLHRARCGAQSVGGTRLVAIVLILFLQYGETLLGCCGRLTARTNQMGEVSDFALDGDTHA